MKIATWNVNSVKARLEAVLGWLKESSPDVAGFQEIKCIDENFPRLEIESLGYNVITHGQKSYNGVALLSKHPIEDVTRGLPGLEDVQSRYIEALVTPKDAVPIRVVCIYLPNGNPAPGEKYDYKLRWMAALQARVETLLEQEERLIVMGDYNVIPEPEDVHNPAAWANDALFLPATRAAYRKFVNLGLTDAVRACNALPNQYTFWDYQAGAWQKNNGIRIDHLMLSPQAADRLTEAGIDRHVRGWEKASDHVPAWCRLAA
ncbi:Exodeoxyribonuclease III [Alphaproteobacteria bacterium SO-S41]|nr:Exodeoxyribonuclease III [Alphaproteobacteria bacterium SO-S41]